MLFIILILGFLAVVLIILISLAVTGVMEVFPKKAEKFRENGSIKNRNETIDLMISEEDRLTEPFKNVGLFKNTVDLMILGIIEDSGKEYSTDEQ